MGAGAAVGGPEGLGAEVTAPVAMLHVLLATETIEHPEKLFWLGQGQPQPGAGLDGAHGQKGEGQAGAPAREEVHCDNCG